MSLLAAMTICLLEDPPDATEGLVVTEETLERLGELFRAKAAALPLSGSADGDDLHGVAAYCRSQREILCQAHEAMQAMLEQAGEGGTQGQGESGAAGGAPVGG